MRAKGAGRKPSGPVPFVRQIVFIAPEHAEVLKEIGEGNPSAGLRQVLNEHFASAATRERGA
jgi:hypothetical protein